MKIILFILLIICIALFLYLENNQLQINKILIRSHKIPASFRNFKIVHLSDLHNKRFGKNQKRLIHKINDIQPDAIFITGDLIDRRKYHPEISIQLIEHLSLAYPIYFVTGNHEGYSYRFEELEKELQKYPIHILRNTSASIIKEDQQINILGIDDPSFSFLHLAYDNDREQAEEIVIEKAIDEARRNVSTHDYTLLLSHRPEFFSSYVEKEMDVTFCGHAHGGQIRLPGIGGILSPSQGFFPAYSQGIHQKNHSHMVVSRGLGNSLFPQRLFNKPEIVVVTLKQEKAKIPSHRK